MVGVYHLCSFFKGQPLRTIPTVIHDMAGGLVREEIDFGPGRGPAPRLELRLELQRRISELPDRLSEVLVLRYYHDLSEREIAQIAGVPPGTVKSRLHKAVQILREGVKRED